MPASIGYARSYPVVRQDVIVSNKILEERSTVLEGDGRVFLLEEDVNDPGSYWVSCETEETIYRCLYNRLYDGRTWYS